MLDRIKKLIDVKSIVTILLAAVFCYLSVVGKISEEQFMTIFTVVIAFYYGTQAAKKDDVVPDQLEQVTEETKVEEKSGL